MPRATAAGRAPGSTSARPSQHLGVLVGVGEIDTQEETHFDVHADLALEVASLLVRRLVRRVRSADDALQLGFEVHLDDFQVYLAVEQDQATHPDALLGDREDDAHGKEHLSLAAGDGGADTDPDHRLELELAFG